MISHCVGIIRRCCQSNYHIDRSARWGTAQRQIPASDAWHFWTVIIVPVFLWSVTWSHLQM